VGNFAIILIDSLYVHNAQFRFLLGIGGGFLMVMGLRGTVTEQREAFEAKVKESILKENRNE
jgi:hypothetical protein